MRRTHTWNRMERYNRPTINELRLTQEIVGCCDGMNVSRQMKIELKAKYIIVNGNHNYHHSSFKMAFLEVPSSFKKKPKYFRYSNKEPNTINIWAISENSIILFVCHPKFCTSIVFVLSWDHCKSQEKIKTMLMGNFRGQTKSIMVLITFRKWLILLQEESKILKGVI